MVASDVSTLFFSPPGGQGRPFRTTWVGMDAPAGHFFRSRLEGSRAHYAAMGEMTIRGALVTEASLARLPSGSSA